MRGNKIKVTTSDEFKEKCDSNVLYMDYQNINKVVQPGSRVYVDDGLISLVVKSIGRNRILDFDCEPNCRFCSDALCLSPNRT